MRSKNGGGRKAHKTVGSIRGETRVAAQSCWGQLSPTFQPVPKVERSVQIGVGQDATSVEITWEQGPEPVLSEVEGLQVGLNVRHQSVLRS